MGNNISKIADHFKSTHTSVIDSDRVSSRTGEIIIITPTTTSRLYAFVVGNESPQSSETGLNAKIYDLCLLSINIDVVNGRGVS